MNMNDMFSFQVSKDSLPKYHRKGRKRRSYLIGLTCLITGYYLLTVLFAIAAGMGGHGISSPIAVLFSWAAFLIRYAQRGIAPLVIYFGWLLCFSVTTHFLARQEGKFLFLLPTGAYLWGSLCASLAFRSFENEPLLPYLALSVLSILMVVAFGALSWRLEKRLLTHERAAPILEQDPLT
jgi:hypothetical protein